MNDNAVAVCHTMLHTWLSSDSFHFIFCELLSFLGKDSGVFLLPST